MQRFECASNQPRMLARMLADGLDDAMTGAVATHAFRIEELTWAGARIWIHLLPVSAPDTPDSDQLLSPLWPQTRRPCYHGRRPWGSSTSCSSLRA